MANLCPHHFTNQTYTLAHVKFPWAVDQVGRNHSHSRCAARTIKSGTQRPTRSRAGEKTTTQRQEERLLARLFVQSRNIYKQQRGKLLKRVCGELLLQLIRHGVGCLVTVA